MDLIHGLRFPESKLGEWLIVGMDTNTGGMRSGGNSANPDSKVGRWNSSDKFMVEGFVYF